MSNALRLALLALLFAAPAFAGEPAAEPATAPAAPATAPAAITAQEVLEKVENRYIGKTSKARMRMTLELKGGGKKERELELYRSKADNRNQNLFIHFLSPADILNTTYLIVEKDRNKDKWIYLPSFKKTRKIVSKDNTSSFVSSDFTYEDLDTIHADEYDASELAEETVEGEPCWRLTAVKKDLTDSGYAKMRLFVSKEKELPIKAELYDKASGAHTKTLVVRDLKRIQDIWTAHSTVMSDLANGTRTTLELKACEYDLDLPAETFTKRNMEK